MSKNMKKILLALFTLVVFAVPLFAQNVTIKFAMNVEKEDYAKNSFQWTVAGKPTVKDGFDAAAGASKAGSTGGFNVVRYDNAETTKKAAIPAGLRGLVLYPVSDYGTKEFDNLTVTQNGGVIVVRFIHRGTAYELTTDKKGNFNVLTGAKLAKGVADNNKNVFTVNDAFLKAGGDKTKMSDVDWSKVTLVPDTFDPEASMHYEGNLKFSFKKGVLSISGTLKPAK